jgi:prolyl-tRNA synthetase
MSKEEGITVKKSENIAEWYVQVLKKCELADYSPVEGCMIIRPYGYAIWELIQQQFDRILKARGVKNVYFPIFIPERLLEMEKGHLEGFVPEVAWVTHGGEKELKERLAIRPTSETIMYYAFSKWIRSHRDLPLRINQWCNVVRWEATDTRPFLRTREFLWHELHTCHASKEEAEKEVAELLDIYANFSEHVLAIPVIKGKKPEHDKFAGAEYTTCVESLMPDGRSLQMGTSHMLGQVFSKKFEIEFADKDGETKYVWQTCAGFSTRLIGALILVHGDDKGLILPPKVAPYQIVIVPIFTEKNFDTVKAFIDELVEKLSDFRVWVDWSDNTPGWKFNNAEMLGIPLRLEIGEKEVNEKFVTFYRRDINEKGRLELEKLSEEIEEILNEIQHNLLGRAREKMMSRIFVAEDEDELLELLAQAKGYVASKWCGKKSCVDYVKEKVHAQIIMIPFGKPEIKSDKCPICKEKADEIVYWAKKY